MQSDAVLGKKRWRWRSDSLDCGGKVLNELDEA